MTCRLQGKTARAAGIKAVVGCSANTPLFNRGGLFQPPEAPGTGAEPSLGMPPHKIWG